MKRRIESFSRREWDLMSISGMMWVIYPEAPLAFSDVRHVRCECTEGMAGVCPTNNCCGLGRDTE